MNANGTGLQQLTDTPEVEHHPTWAPDGSRLAFSFRSLVTGASYVGVLSLAGNGTELLYQCELGCSSPRWSPTDEVVVFMSIINPGTSTLHFLNPTTGEVSAFEAAPAGYNRPGGWSPDGTRFVFSSTRDHPEGDLFIRDAQGGVTPLTNGSNPEVQPAWSR